MAEYCGVDHYEVTSPLMIPAVFSRGLVTDSRIEKVWTTPKV